MIGEFAVHRNYRTEDEFKPECCCDFCATNFNTYLIKLPDTKKYVCKGCLSQMSDMLDQAQVRDFRTDFIKGRSDLISSSVMREEVLKEVQC